MYILWISVKKFKSFWHHGPQHLTLLSQIISYISIATSHTVIWTRLWDPSKNLAYHLCVDINPYTNMLAYFYISPNFCSLKRIWVMLHVFKLKISFIHQLKFLFFFFWVEYLLCSPYLSGSMEYISLYSLNCNTGSLKIDIGFARKL